MKWLFHVIVFVCVFYRSAYGGKAGVPTVDRVTYYGDTNFLKAGDHKSISCKASTKDQNVEWLYPNGTMVRHIPSNRVFSQSHFVQSFKGRTPALVLTITSAEAGDTGVYVCQAGQHSVEVPLCVIEPAEFVSTADVVDTDIGRSITLSCQAKGQPEPRIQWTRNGEIISDDESEKYKLMTKFNIEGFEALLTITSLTPEDSGVYTCVSLQETIEVDDCGHRETHNITLNVKYAPTFELGNETNSYARNNEQVKLTCSASGYPLPTYRWFREISNDSLVEYDKKKFKYSEEDNEAVLTVLASSGTFGQRYKCEATNDLGSVEQYFTLLRLEKPTRIDEVQPVATANRALVLNVTWFDEISFPVDSFQIQYIKHEDGNKRKFYLKEASWKKSKQIEVELSKKEAAELTGLEGTLVTLPDLEEELTYWVRIRAVNSAGTSVWSEPTSATVDAEEETTAAPTTTEAESSAAEETEADSSEEPMTDSMFYGIFFAGGIFVVALVCMLAMRMVK